MLGGSSSAAEAKQAGDKSDRKSKLRVEEEMTEQANGVIVVTAALQESKGGGEDGALRVGQVGLGNVGVGQPTGEVRNCCGHGIPSVASGDGGSVGRHSWKFTKKSQKTVWC